MLPSLSLLAAVGACTAPLAIANQLTNSHLNYSVVTGYFLQDVASTNASTFNFTTANFGLINHTYPAGSNNHDSQTQWQRFQHQVSKLNYDAPRNVQYKVLFLSRHGEGYHNAAEAYYGTPAWNCYYSILDGNATITWADAHLTDLGIAQALAVNKFWESEIKTQKIQTPQSFYTSPLTRCLATAKLTFSGLKLGQPFIPTVKELLREGISGHTCDRRGSKTYIQSSFPNYKIEDGFPENDPLWEPLHGETSLDQDARSRKILDDIFGHDRNTYVSITSHSGEISSILRVLGHRPFPLSTGGAIPVLVRADTIKGVDQVTPEQPYAGICTCTAPPAKAATSSECTIATATVAPPGGGPN